MRSRSAGGARAARHGKLFTPLVPFLLGESGMTRTLVALVAVASAALAAPPAPRPPHGLVCHSCFWRHFPELKDELIDVYKRYECANDFCRAEVAYLLGTVLEEPARVHASYPLYLKTLEGETDPARRRILSEILGFVAASAGRDPAPHFAEAARLSAQLGLGEWRQELLAQLAAGEARPQFGDIAIRTDLKAPAGTTAYVLGETTIAVRRGARVGVQLERTVRDWLSYKMDYDLDAAKATLGSILDYHEGARLRNLMEAAQVQVVPFTGTFLASRGGRWYAPDENGVFRFHVLDDKVQYPTVKEHGGIALMTDTHGISSMVEQAVRQRVDLVIGCGDNPGKAHASYYLAGKGIDVYFPCDREVGMLLGHGQPGRILGTAPVRRTAEGAEIGNQPVRFETAETIVVEDIAADGPHRYYDAPMRYFKALAALVPLKIHPVTIAAVKETGKAVAEAERVGARAIAVRVAFDEDHAPVSRWLKASKDHRAVLFHSAPYTAGYRLFAEFPGQVTFGDPRPRFIAGGGSARPAASTGLMARTASGRTSR